MLLLPLLAAPSFAGENARSMPPLTDAGCRPVDGKQRYWGHADGSQLDFGRELRAGPAADGQRLTGIARGGVMDSCGFKNGDILTTIDGHSVAAPDELVTRLTDFDGTPGLHTFTLTRRGAATTLVIETTEPGTPRP